MPGPGRRRILLWTTVSTRVCGSSLPISGLRMSASMKSVRSSRASGGRSSRPATYSISGSDSSRRASSVPRKLPTPVISTRLGRISGRLGLRLRLGPRLWLRGRALGRGPGARRGQPRLDRVEPAADRAQVGADRLHVLLGRPAARRPRSCAGTPRRRRRRGTISSTASCARSRVSCADPTVAWTVRSTASRTASGTCCLGLLAIALAVWHIVRRVTEPAPIHLKPADRAGHAGALAGRSAPGPRGRAGRPRIAAHVQPPPRPLGLQRHRPGRRAALRPGHRHGRSQRGDRDRGADHARGHHAHPHRDLRRPGPRPWDRRAGDRRARAVGRRGERRARRAGLGGR